MIGWVKFYGMPPHHQINGEPDLATCLQKPPPFKNLANFNQPSLTSISMTVITLQKKIALSND